MQGLVELNKSFPRNKFKIRTFFKMFSELYENHTSLKDFSIKVKNLQVPWINKVLKKLPKQKKNYINRFKMSKSTRTRNIFLKNYIKKLSKHTINLYLRIVKMTWKRTWYAHDTHMARTWQIMKEITEKCKVNSNRFL